MPLNQSQYSSLIILEVGDTASGVITTNIATLWTKWDTIADLDAQALYVKRDAIELVLGEVRKQTTIRAADGSSVDLNKLFDHLIAMRTATLDQIEAAQSGLGGGIAVGQLTTTAPIMRDTNSQPDP